MAPGMTQTMAPSGAHHVTTQAHSDGAWYATCRTCGWHSDPTFTEPLAVILAGRHRQSVIPQPKIHSWGWAAASIGGMVPVSFVVGAVVGSGLGAIAGFWFVLLLAAATCLAYLTPMLLAVSRRHHNIRAIAGVNILFGWTLLGWAVALAMAASAVQLPQRRNQ
jgi:hypothetical protein